MPQPRAKEVMLSVEQTWQGDNLDLCEAAQFLDRTINLAGGFVLNPATWPADPAWKEPGWPNLKGYLDGNWHALPYTDNFMGHGVGNCMDANGNQQICPTTMDVTITLKARDKTTKEVKATTSVGFTYRNYDPKKNPPMPSDADARFNQH